MNNTLTFCFSAGKGAGEFNTTDYEALSRSIHRMSTLHEFEYATTDSPQNADIVFFHEKAPDKWKLQDRPFIPQIIVGSTCQTCIGAQHDIPWGQIESSIVILAYTILHQRMIAEI
jgi:hypothetical protein